MAKNKTIKIKKIILASDHAGFKLKEDIKNFLIKRRKKILDLGTNNTNSVDYPEYAHRLSSKMKKNSKQLGILVCGSGAGMYMTANRHKNIRAAFCYNVKSTKLSIPLNKYADLQSGEHKCTVSVKDERNNETNYELNFRLLED